MDRLRSFTEIAIVTIADRTHRRILRVVCLASLLLAIVGTGAAVAIQASRPNVHAIADLKLTVDPPIRTGYQRSERLVFTPGGRHLAVACPRYNRVVIYRLTSQNEPARVADIRVEGRPVALQAGDDRIYVLQRPSGDARHLEPAWWQAYAFSGDPVGPKFRVGWDPDDMVLVDGGRVMIVILSGHAEGESNRPDPSLVVVDLADPDQPRIRGQIEFVECGDNPAQIAFIPGVRMETAAQPLGMAVVSLRGSNQLAWVEIKDLDHLQLVARSTLPGEGVPGAIAYGPPSSIFVTDVRASKIWSIEPPGRIAEDEPAPAWHSAEPKLAAEGMAVGELCLDQVDTNGRGMLLGTLPDDSALVVLDRESGSHTTVPLAGALGFGTVIPMAVAMSNSLGSTTVAVTDRSGGVHLARLLPDENANPR